MKISAAVSTILIFAMLAANAWSAPAPAAQPAVTVTTLVPSQPNGALIDQVGVTVFFTFAPESRILLKRLDRWASNAGDNVVIDREPIVPPGSSILAHAYMAARTLGIANPVLDGLFNIRPDPAHPQATRQALTKLFRSWGAGKLEFDAAWDSSATRGGMLRAESLAERFGIKTGPAIVVDGLWRLTPTRPGASAYSALFAALDTKVARAAQIASENQ